MAKQNCKKRKKINKEFQIKGERSAMLAAV